MLIAFIAAGDLCAQSLPAEPPIQLKITQTPGAVELQRPVNSTLKIRVARRPWLDERLIEPKPAPTIDPVASINPAPSASSIKMHRAHAPTGLPEPPSMFPGSWERSSAGWVNRRHKVGSRPNFADLPVIQAPSDRIDRSQSFQTIGTSLPPRPGTLRPQTDARRTASSNVLNQSNHPLSPDSLHQSIQEPVQAAQQSALDVPHTVAAEAVTSQESVAANDAIAEETVISDGVVENSFVADEAMAAGDTIADKAVVEDSPAEEAVAAGDAIAENATASPQPEAIEPTDESLSGTDELTVRELEIDHEGMSIEEYEKAALPNNRATADDEFTSSAPQVEPPTAAVPLDYAGFPQTRIRLTNPVARMKNPIRQCLLHYYGQLEIVTDRSNWGMLHAIMVYGRDTKVRAGDKTYSTIGWIAGNNFCRGQKLIEDQNGSIFVKSGIGLQGHQAQMLAIFSLCDVPENYPMYAGENRYTIRDVVDAEMLACKSDAELTFTLIGLSHYLNTESNWKNADGEIWSFERLIREELAKPIVGTACGGTHRLMGFAHVLRERRAEGRPITGQWKRAELFMQDFVEYAYQLQNRDGSMSTEWFEGREDNGKMDRKIQTTGHMVEWLLTVTPDSQLQNPQLVGAIEFLLESMSDNRTHEWSIGPKGHSLRSLAMYYERVYKSGPAWRSRSVARAKTTWWRR